MDHQWTMDGVPSMTRRPPPIGPFYLNPTPADRSPVRASITAALDAVPTDERHVVTIRQDTHGRGAEQNALIRVWAAEWAEARGLELDEAHGEIKQMVLLPLKLSWPDTHDEATLERDLVDTFLGSDHFLVACDRLIRSRDLAVRPFGDYLSAVQRRGSTLGMTLVAKTDGAMRALGSAGG